jgi:hypothetical protein
VPGTENGGDDEIVGISRDRVPVRKREILVVKHLTDDALELIEHRRCHGRKNHCW